MLITRRLFVGIPLSERLQKRLSSEIARFKHLPIIPTRNGNFHITLMFLGFVNEEGIPEIVEALEDAVIDIEPFEVDLSEIRAEPNAEHPTMIWFAGEPSAALVELRNAVANALAYLTPESKTFRPHVTLAKIRRGKYEMLEEKPDFTKTLHVIEPVDSIALFESTTVEGKRAYLPLAEFPLGGE
jgi:2'-5' RNA ligase